jgi:iron complex transport system substrate-binding protein
MEAVSRKTVAALAAVVLALVAAAAPSIGQTPPRRVMSINQCSDQLLLSLLPPERISSITWLSRTSKNSYLAVEAARVPVNFGTAEEVLAQRPDLVIAGLYSTIAARLILKRTGIRLIELPPAENFDEIRESTRFIAREVGAVERGEELIRRMDETLAELRRTAPPRPFIVAGWNSPGSVPGKGSLFDSILTAAGGVNIAASWSGPGYGTFDVEQILALRPDILAYGDASIETPGLRSSQARHPAIQRFYANRQIVYPSSLYACGVPQSADAAVALRREMFKLMANEAP